MSNPETRYDTETNTMIKLLHRMKVGSGEVGFYARRSKVVKMSEYGEQVVRRWSFKWS